MKTIVNVSFKCTQQESEVYAKASQFYPINAVKDYPLFCPINGL